MWCSLIVGIGISGYNTNSVSLNPNVQIGKKVYFGMYGVGDSFQSTSPIVLFDEKKINQMISQNPEIKNILNKNNIPVKLNMEELQNLRDNHCKDTMEISVAIAKNLPPALKQYVDMKNLKEGSLLHDIGKVLIPNEILNKNGALTPQEHAVMDLHAELGYQMLRTTGIDNEVLRLVRYHHKNDIPDINLQILNLADKYSALTEKRVYKNELSPKQALTIIYSDVKSGEVDPMLFNALVKSIYDKESPRIVNKY